jgi:hypothetical protein
LVVRDADGEELEIIYDDTASDTSSADIDTAVTATLDAYAGQIIVLSFEARYSDAGDNKCLIDDISVKDGDDTEYVTNGDFETGNLNGWTTNTPTEVQNVTSGAREIDGLTITRSFYTVPNKFWGRWVDVFENNTDETITATVVYETDLGSDSYGIIYETPGTTTTAVTKAITAWDGNTDDRDIGMVFGINDGVDFTSDTALEEGGGSEYIDTTYEITVTAGSRVAIVNFIVMNGVDTGLTAEDIDAKATAIDAEVLKIVNDFWKDRQYRNGMTQKQIDAILNFPK